MYAVLKQTQRKIAKKVCFNKFITFDTETKDGLRGKELYCWSICEGSNGGKSKRFRVEQGLDITSLMAYFENYRKHENEMDKKQPDKVVKCYVHNLGFDIRFLMEEWVKRDIQFHLIETGGLIACMLREYHVVFQDTVQFLQCSQEDAEIEFDVNEEYRKIDCHDLFEKEYSEWTKEDRQRMLAHNRNDVIALHEIMNTLQHELYQIAGVKLQNVFTPASLAVKTFQKFLPFDIPNPFIKLTYNPTTKEYTKELMGRREEFVRKAFYGGRTEVFNNSHITDAYYVDKVSMYPHVMRNKFFPIGIPYMVYDEQKIRNELTDGKLGILEVEIVNTPDLQYPLLPVRHDGKLLFPRMADQTSHYTSVEFIRAEELGYRMRIIKALIYPEKSDSIFNEYVDTFFKIKQESIGGKKLLAKLFLNSLYGKFAQNPLRTNRVNQYFMDEYEALAFGSELDPDTDPEVFTCEEMGLYCCQYTEISTTLKPFMNISIGAFITSYARLELYDMIEKCEELEKQVYYCDTDSVVIESIEGIALGKALGNWDIEHTFHEFQAFAPKTYLFRYTDKKTHEICVGLKAKGLPKDVKKALVGKHPTFDAIADALRHGVHIDERYNKIKTSINRFGTFLSSSSTYKTFLLENSKRIHDEFGSSVPFFIHADIIQ